MKANPEAFRALADLVEKGLSPTRAGLVLQIARSTVSAWRREFPEFDTMIDQAEAKFIASMTANIAVAAAKDWRAAVEILARRFPSEFSLASGSSREPETAHADQLQEMISMARSPSGRTILLRAGVIDDAWLERNLPAEVMSLRTRVKAACITVQAEK